MNERVEPTLGESGPQAPAPAVPDALVAERRAWNPEPLKPVDYVPPPAQQPPKKRRGRGWIIFFILVVLPLALVFVPVFYLKWLPPVTSAFMLQSEVQPVHYTWVPASQIADSARKAVVASEDQKFWLHNGFDVEAIEKAYTYNQTAKKHRRGASTISQQTAKNLFLWAGGGYFRKGIEAMYTVLMEKIWGKDRIIEMYLNLAEFGPGIYGVEAASQIYFKHPASKLTPDEAARLAAVLPSPRRWSVTKPGPYVLTRIAWVMRQMGYGRQAPEEDSEPPEPPPQDAADPNSADAPDYNFKNGEEPPLPPPAPWPDAPASSGEPSAAPAPESVEQPQSQQ